MVSASWAAPNLVLASAALTLSAGCAHDEVCDWEDNDRDGVIDEGFDADGDGHWACGLSELNHQAGDYDCDDQDPQVHPGQEDVCDGVDNDCSGAADEGCGAVLAEMPAGLVFVQVITPTGAARAEVMVGGWDDLIGYELLRFVSADDTPLGRVYSTAIGVPPILALTSLAADGSSALLGVTPKAISRMALTDDGAAVIETTALWAGDPFDRACVTTGDVDGDGHEDLVVAGPLAMAYEEAVRVVTMDDEAGATLEQSLRTSLRFGPSFVGLTDLDRDGAPDIVVAGDQLVLWWLGDGRGHFQEGGMITLPADLGQAILVDLNGDGWEELAVTIPDRWKLWTFSGGGVGAQALSGPSDIPTGLRHPRGLAALDVDGDGAPELIVSDSYEQQLAVLRRGPAGFAPLCKVATFPGVTSLLPADLGAGSQPDLVLVAEEADQVSFTLDLCR